MKASPADKILTIPQSPLPRAQPTSLQRPLSPPQCHPHICTLNCNFFFLPNKYKREQMFWKGLEVFEILCKIILFLLPFLKYTFRNYHKFILKYLL